MMKSSSTETRASKRSGMLWLVAVLLLVLGWLFLDSFKPGEAVFANDGPLGAQVSDIYKMPGAFFGIWVLVNSIVSDSDLSSGIVPIIPYFVFFELGILSRYVPGVKEVAKRMVKYSP